MSRLILIFLVLSSLALVSSAQASKEKEDNIWKISEAPEDNVQSLPLILDLEAGTGLIFERFDNDDYFSKTMQFSTAAEYEATSWLWINALFDTGYLSYEDGEFVSPDEDAEDGIRTASDFFMAGDPIRGISLTTGYKGLTLQLGRVPLSIGEGLIYENYGVGVIARLDGEAQFGSPLRAELTTQMVGSKWSDYSSKNTISSLHLEYDLSHFESIYLIGAYYRERENNLTNAIMAPDFATRESDNEEACENDPNSEACFRSSIQLAVPGDQTITSSTGDLKYLGIGGNLFLFNQLSLRGLVIGMFGTGSTTIQPPAPPEQDVQNRPPGMEPPPQPPTFIFDAKFQAFAAQLQATVVLNEAWEFSWELFALSGNPTDLRPRHNTTKTYTSFVGISPYWAWSGIFFESGLDRDAYSSRAKVAGDYGRGVAGLGPKVNFTKKDLSLEFRALGLYALNEAGSPYAAFPTYGIELNAISDWNITHYLRLATEADIFFPGNSYENTDLAFRVLGFLNVQFNL